MEHLLHVIRAFCLQAHHLEELFVVEGVCSCWEEGEEVKEGQDRGTGKSCCSIKGHPHGCGEQESRGSPARKGCSAQGRTFLVPPMHTLKSLMKTVGLLRTVFL